MAVHVPGREQLRELVVMAVHVPGREQLRELSVMAVHVPVREQLRELVVPERERVTIASCANIAK